MVMIRRPWPGVGKRGSAMAARCDLDGHLIKTGHVKSSKKSVKSNYPMQLGGDCGPWKIWPCILPWGRPTHLGYDSTEKPCGYAASAGTLYRQDRHCPGCPGWQTCQRSWLETSNSDAVEVAQALAPLGPAAFIYTDIIETAC